MEIIKIKIEPIKFYNKYDGSDHTLAKICFDIGGRTFCSECNDRCLLELIDVIDRYFDGKIKKNTELYFDVPWIIGGFVKYPFSFRIKPKRKMWIFRYERNPNDEKFDFVYPLKNEDILSMRAQIKKQYSEINWNSIGKTELYDLDLPARDYRWCYSAGKLESALIGLCRDRTIKDVYVSATNYADPLRVSENYVNYFVGSEVFVELEGLLLNFLIFASGLVRWRAFRDGEYSIAGPRVDFIRDGGREFCKMRDAYGAFKLAYQDTEIDTVTVSSTDYFPFEPPEFEPELLTSPIELPEKIFFTLKNGTTLSFRGLDDDFVIEALRAPVEKEDSL